MCLWMQYRHKLAHNTPGFKSEELMYGSIVRVTFTWKLNKRLLLNLLLLSENKLWPSAVLLKIWERLSKVIKLTRDTTFANKRQGRRNELAWKGLLSWLFWIIPDNGFSYVFSSSQYHSTFATSIQAKALEALCSTNDCKMMFVWG